MKAVLKAVLIIIALFLVYSVVDFLILRIKYANFEKRTISELPINREDIVGVKVKHNNSRKQYFIEFIDKGVLNSTYTAYEDNIKIHYDIKNGEKPYITYKYLNYDVAFPNFDKWIVLHGVYGIEIHVTKELCKNALRVDSMGLFRKQDRNKKVEIVGVYEVKENQDVHLIELIIHAKSNGINVNKITQEDPKQPRDNWQVAYDERYLNTAGTKIIGDFFDKPEENMEPCRLTFFMFFVDFDRPLITQFGKVSLSKPTVMPERLIEIIRYENTD